MCSPVCFKCGSKHLLRNDRFIYTHIDEESLACPAAYTFWLVDSVHMYVIGVEAEFMFRSKGFAHSFA